MSRARTLLALVTLAVAGCSTAQVAQPDARRIDAATLDADPDAAPTDAVVADGEPPDGPGPGCTISTGDTVILDGDGDLAAYPAAQVLSPGVPLLASDRVAITWDPTYLYVTATAGSFADNAFRPLHLYLQTGTTLPAATTSTGKEYGGNTPFLPFAPTQLIAIRRTDDAGTGAYDGVYVPGAPVTWATRSFPLVPGTHVFASADNGTLSVRTPWTALGGCPTTMRLAAHVVHGVVANEWKDAVPTTHTPWVTPGGGYYQIDLTAAPAIAGWSQP